MKSFFSKKYRIVTAQYGFIAQYRFAWWPFWSELYSSIAHNTVEDAQKRIDQDKRKDAFKPEVVWESEQSKPE